MKELPSFKTRNLFLRKVLLSDSSNYQRYFADFEVVRMLSRVVPWPYPDSGAEDYIKNIMLPNQGHNRWSWAICLKETPHALIGCIELFQNEQPWNRGFWLAKEYWGKGFMTEAVEPVTDFAFSVLDFEKLIFANAVQNIASRRVKEKSGARFLKVMPAEFVDDRLKEQEMWELTKVEWQKLNPLKNFKS